MKHCSVWQLPEYSSNADKQTVITLNKYPVLRGKYRTDVLIIGGGMAGILTAKLLSEKGVSCAVTEMNRVFGGVSGNTTAKITVGHGLIYSRIAERYSNEYAKMYLDANNDALRKFADLAENIPCDFSRSDSYIYTRRNPRAIENELRVLDKIGGNAKYADKLNLPFPAEGAVCFENQAQFNPLKFVSGILGEMKNVKIFEHTHIIDIEDKTAYSAEGSITADAIVIATHFPFLNRCGCYFLKMYQSRSYAAALENAPLCDGMYMDENPAGFSFRSCGKYLLVGGGAHKTGETCRRSELLDFIGSCYKGAEIATLWSAQDCISLDGIPYIGHYGRTHRDWYVASGFNKWGMTSSMTAAVLLSDMIIGRQNKNAAVFNPSRNMFGKNLAVNAANAAKNLLTPTAPRCPHMGCALKKNPAEHTWECPCHGSRFSEKGELLDNPANRNL